MACCVSKHELVIIMGLSVHVHVGKKGVRGRPWKSSPTYDDHYLYSGQFLVRFTNNVRRSLPKMGNSLSDSSSMADDGKHISSFSRPSVVLRPQQIIKSRATWTMYIF